MPVSSLRALRRPAFYAALCTILFIAGNSLPATASSAVSGVRPIELPGHPGAPQSAVYGINNDGVLVGSSGTAERSTPEGAITDLDLLPGGTDARAVAINAYGTIAGHLASDIYTINDRGVCAGFS
jgi:hypothetical protein